MRHLRLNSHSIAWEKNSLCRFKVVADAVGFVQKWFGVKNPETGVLAVIQVVKPWVLL